MQRSSNKSDIGAEEYGKASAHTRLHNPENTGTVVQTTSENDSVVWSRPAGTDFVTVWFSGEIQITEASPSQRVTQLIEEGSVRKRPETRGTLAAPVASN